MLKFIFQRPEALLVLSFAALILVGGVALRLPAASTQRVGLLDAMFISTSAVCVTGLSTVDFATVFTRFGMTIVLIQIQLGGLGLMTFAAVAAELFRGKVSFSSQAALNDAFFQGGVSGGLRRALRNILLMTFAFEATGAALMLAGLRQIDQPDAGVFSAVFLSISAFCNAGFSVYNDNAISLSDSTLCMWTLMALITVGGIGHTVLTEIGRRFLLFVARIRSPQVTWTLHSRVVLCSSALLTFGGATAILLTGLSDYAGVRFTPLEYAQHALFQSVTSRTAGFNTVDFSAIPVPTLMVIILLMFIGGSPGSCAGGVKTTTVSVWVASVVGRVRGQSEVALFERRVPEETVRRATLIIALACLWTGVGIFLMVFTERVGSATRLEHVIFEQVSALGTVGLSAGLTPKLSDAGKVWIMVSMFLGRVGPLTLAVAVIRQHARPRFTYPQERVMIG